MNCNLEKEIISYCAPTLAGMKCGSLFRYYCKKEQGIKDIRDVNYKLNVKGIYIVPLKWEEEAVLIYVFRCRMLIEMLESENNNNLLELIKSYGPKIVVITDGSRGASFYDGTSFYHQKIVKEKKHLDTTGIGDVFNSTFSAGLLFYKGDIVKAARLASRNAASKISHLGAQNGLLSKKELMK